MSAGADRHGRPDHTDITNCKRENIVAFADPDEKRAARTFKEYPDVPRFKDFRQMLDKMSNQIEVVTVSTHDHMHGTAAMWAMARGKRNN